MRRCTCDRLPPDGSPYTTDYCRLCWLYHNDPAYRDLWDGPDLPGAVAPVAPPHRGLPCIYLGDVVDRQGCRCPARWKRTCGLHGIVTIQDCKSCPDYEAV